MSKKDRFTEAESEFRRSFPTGTTVEQAAARLDSLGIAHSPFRPDSSKINAIVRSVAKDAMTRTDAQFEMTFDSTSRLTGITAKRVVTGP